MQWMITICYSSPFGFLEMKFQPVRPHVLDGAGSFPAKHFFCFGSISIAGSDVACTTWCDLVVDAVSACFFECVENLENAGTVAGSKVDGFHAGVGQAVVNCFEVTQCEVYNMDVVADARFRLRCRSHRRIRSDMAACRLQPVRCMAEGCLECRLDLRR